MDRDNGKPGEKPQSDQLRETIPIINDHSISDALYHSALNEVTSSRRTKIPISSLFYSENSLRKIRLPDVDIKEQSIPSATPDNQIERLQKEKDELVEKNRRLAAGNKALTTERDLIKKALDKISSNLKLVEAIVEKQAEALNEARVRIPTLELHNTMLKAENARLRNRPPATAPAETRDLLDPKGYCKALGLDPRLIKTLSPDKLEKLLTSLHRAYSLVHHPDTGGNTEAMKAVNTAYDFLKDPQKRRSYGR